MFCHIPQIVKIVVVLRVLNVAHAHFLFYQKWCVAEKEHGQ